MLGLKMMTMVDATDGIKFDFMAPLSPKFQMGGSWSFSNTKANKFELNTALSSATGNMMNQDEMSFVSTRSDSTGKLEFSGSYNMGNNFSLKAEGFFMDEDIQKSHVSFEVMKEFSDSHLAYKIGGGSQQFSMMQALSPKLLGGFEMYYIVSFRLSNPTSLTQKKSTSATEATTLTRTINSSPNTSLSPGKRPFPSGTWEGRASASHSSPS